jgi:hypothetical protein
MGELTDLTALTTPAAGDLLLVRDISDASDKDKSLALSKMGVLNLAAVWSAIQAFGAGISFSSGAVFPFISVAVNSGQTWTIDITMAAARNMAIVDVQVTIGTNATNTWAIISRRVTFRADVTVGNNATIIANTDLGSGAGSSITVTGPTAIANGIRFTMAAGASTTASSNQALITVVGRQSNLTVSSSVV